MNDPISVSPWRILVVDDKSDAGVSLATRLNKEKFKGIPTECETCGFDEAPVWLKQRHFDLAILDLVDNSTPRWAGLGAGVEPPNDQDAREAGEGLLEQIQSTRPLPVVFYTAHPGKLEGQTNLVTRVVDRGGSPASLFTEISDIFASGVPSLARKIQDIQRNYLWGFVATHSQQIERDGIAGELAMLLARRLAFRLREESLNGQSPDHVRPIEYYIYPDLQGCPRAGGLVRSKADNRYWLILTPSCDLDLKKDKRNAESVLLAECRAIEEYSALKSWKTKVDDKDKIASVRRLLSGNAPQTDRGFYLPAAHDIPGMMADFQLTQSVKYPDFEANYQRVATLDSPFAEAALARYARYFGRLGTPDLDLEFVLNRLAAGSESKLES